MRNFLNLFTKLYYAKEHKGLTEFLVNNPAFRAFALRTHAAKQDASKAMEKYLDKELLGKTEGESKKIDTKNNNTQHRY